MTAENVSYESNGLFDAAEYLHTLNIVDSEKVAVMGHSLGGGSSIKLYSYIISVGITAFIHVRSQNYTGSIWAGVLINSLIICMITVANCNSITAF